MFKRVPDKVKPIKPSEVVKKKQESMPDGVIECFNEMIASEWDGHSSCIRQKDVAAMIASRMSVKTAQVYDNGWLDVEEIFEKAGWDVDYDKPAYCETYEATFTFSKKKR